MIDSNANIEMKPQLSSRGKVTNEAYKKPSMECKRTISVPMSLSELRELVVDREAWRAAILGVTKSWT